VCRSLPQPLWVTLLTGTNMALSIVRIELRNQRECGGGQRWRWGWRCGWLRVAKRTGRVW